jgi:hypothetical protein
MLLLIACFNFGCRDYDLSCWHSIKPLLILILLRGTIGYKVCGRHWLHHRKEGDAKWEVEEDEQRQNCGESLQER